MWEKCFCFLICEQKHYSVTMLPTSTQINTSSRLPSSLFMLPIPPKSNYLCPTITRSQPPPPLTKTLGGATIPHRPQSTFAPLELYLQTMEQ